MNYKDYIFVDVGAYDGDTIKDFFKKYKKPVASEKFKIYAIEPNPKFFPTLVKLMDEIPNLVEVETGAAWVRDEVREFAVDHTEDAPMGSTLMEGKTVWDIFPKIEIHCFDFSEWIKQFKDCYVIVKMDCEGAEFPVLRKMIDDGTIKLVNQLWLETHQNKVIEYTSEDASNLRKELAQYTHIEDWG